MTGAYDWLPVAVRIEAYDGDWVAYEAAMLQLFEIDYLAVQVKCGGHVVRITCTPPVASRNPTFWHLISKGSDPVNRTLNAERCARILWPKAIIEALNDVLGGTPRPIRYWKNDRGGEEQLLIALDDFSYLVVLKIRKGNPVSHYLVLWTAYDVEFESQREKLRKECEAYWKRKNSSPKN